ncbi:MAG: hypothetical protein BWX63_02016 [Bacteroidetes bacterium ADurb.Bin041]|jgi:hypothetical protein|nr:MAG: hypothetical protein BWX63_02016 [Bacteroidetes bacterium ADurb.Bin041]
MPEFENKPFYGAVAFLIANSSSDYMAEKIV